MKRYIGKNKYKLKRKALKSLIRIESYKKYIVLNRNLRKISKNTDENTKNYWKILQKKYCNEIRNINYETQYDYWMLKNDITSKEIMQQQKYKFRI